MKKFHKTKKLFALWCSMLLIFSVAIPVAAAAQNGNLVIGGLTDQEDVTVTAYQVLEFDNGWQLTDWAKTALDNDADAALAALTDEANSDSSAIAGYLTTLAGVNTKEASATATGKTSVTLNTTELGSYLVICESDNWTYTNMLVNNYNSDGTGNDILTVRTATAKGVQKNIIEDKTVAAGQEYVAVGDVIDYTVTGTFPYFQGYDKPVFTITDTMSANLKAVTTGESGAWTADDITVTVKSTALALGTAYTVTSNENGFVIEFVQDWLKANAAAYAGADFEVTYQGLVMAYSADGYTNTVNSSVKTHDTEDGEPETPDTPVDVTSYTAAIELKKTDEDGTNVLEGAEFVLAAASGDNSGKYVVLTTADGKSTVTFTDDKENAATKFKTDENGVVSIEGLDPDFTYVLEEFKAPSGYQLEKTMPTVAFTAEKDADGKATGAYKAALTEGGEAWLNGNASAANASVEITLKDSKMGALPATGGAGVIILTVIGAAMMAVFGGTFVAMKKKR